MMCSPILDINIIEAKSLHFTLQFFCSVEPEEFVQLHTDCTGCLFVTRCNYLADTFHCVMTSCLYKLLLLTSAFYLFILLSSLMFLLTNLNHTVAVTCVEWIPFSFPISALSIPSSLICPVAYLYPSLLCPVGSLHPCAILRSLSSAPPSSEDPAPPLSEADELLNK